MDSIRVIIEEEVKFAGDFDIPGLTKGGTASILLHFSILLMISLVTHQKKKSELMLTEITMVDQIIPEPEPEEPPAPMVPPPEQKNVWDFLKQAIPLKTDQPMTANLPIDLPKKQAAPEMAAMPDALKLGDKKDLNNPSLMDKPLDLVGRKAVAAPAGMNVNPLQMNKKQDSLAMTSNLPTGINLGKSSSFLPQKSMPVVSSDAFAKRANLGARGGGLADMPAIQKPVEKKKMDFDTSSLKIERSGNTFKIFGALQNRAILEKYLPKYPRWAEEQGLECTVSIHFFVFPGGEVKDNLFVEQSSGYSEMDNLAVKALRAFKFAPLAPGERQEEQEGVIVFYFRLSR